MAVAFDAVGPSSAGTTGASPLSWTHTPAGTPSYVIVGASIKAGNAAVDSWTATYGGVSMVELGRRASGDITDGWAIMWGLASPPSGAQTVTLTRVSGGTNAIGGSITFTGGTTVGTAVTAAGDNSAGTVPPSVAVTGTTAGNMVVDLIVYGQAISGPNQTQRWNDNVDTVTAAGNAAQSTAAGGGTVTMSYTPTAHDVWGMVAVEVQADAAAAIPYSPPRSAPVRDPGEVSWIQRDRRDANTVATAANPLTAPLDTTWQAGGRYWHLYNDLAYRSTLAPYAQRDRRDANTLGSSATDPLTVAGGVGGDTWRRYNTPASADRREVPQQRPYVSDPGMLLAPFLLENELLGGADSGRHYSTPATHADRREVPQQRRYLSDPLLLASALLENELLGSADDQRRRYGQAAYYDRRQAGQQRPAFAAIDDLVVIGTGALGAWWSHEDWSTSAIGNMRRFTDPAGLPQPTPHDPTLDGWWPAWLEANRAATHVDRREVPQQRLYVSDPSFYPTVPPTDPLTVAWGAGGNYWHLYNDWCRPAELGQQRRYISDPAMLATALLEDALLGGADDQRRRYAAWAADRRQVPQQRAYISDPTLLTAAADPNTSVADLWRRWFTPAYWDRREVPQQPPRWTLFFDAGPDTPPLTLAFGAGGDLWHRSNWRRPARSWWPSRLVFASASCDCTTHRPSVGVTTRPSAGITTRPCTC